MTIQLQAITLTSFLQGVDTCPLAALPKPLPKNMTRWTFPLSAGGATVAAISSIVPWTALYRLNLKNLLSCQQLTTQALLCSTPSSTVLSKLSRDAGLAPL
jgi:hypothetical protein